MYTERMAKAATKLLRIPPDLLDALTDWAEADDRSVNSLIVHLLRRALAERDRVAA